ncbi:uncharacterized protein LOC125504273 [Dendroctonus ponderosae]|uniref:uncharacterized protein LOC125504273 n=1 Tax=Dendroctonus ponderosae TaxID=77166 RepID=UPI0020350026|nr:uncharacterized protein LOC125504273 [Dendroctonus ponderosae]
MKLTPGTCGLCAVSGPVIVPFDHTKIAAFLPETLKSYIGVPMIKEISSELQVCCFCLAHMLQVVQYEESLGTFSTLNHRCSICRNVEHLVNITEWSHFDVLLENINAKRKKKCAVCLPCIAHLERLNVIKEHFLKRVSKLQNSRCRTTKRQITRNKLPRGKEGPDNQCKLHNGPNVDLKSKTRSKPTKTGLGLNHLKPLKYSEFNVDEYKNDTRLLDQIAFVSLKSALTSVKVSTQVEKPRKNQKRAKTVKNKKPKKSLNKQVKTSKPKRVLKARQQNPKTKQLIVRILKANLDELIHTAQQDGDEAKLSTEGDVELSSQNNDEIQELFTDELETPDSPLKNYLLKKALSELITNEENSSKTLKRTTPEESNSEIKSNELDSLSVKRPKIDAINQAKTDASGPFEPVDLFDALCSSVKVSQNNVLKQSPIDAKESEDVLSLEITLADLVIKQEEDNSSLCSDQTDIFTDFNQVKCIETKEMRRFATLDSDIEVADLKVESISEDTIVTLAELRAAQNSLHVTSSRDTEDGSHINNSQLIKENSATHEKKLADKTEKPLEAEDASQEVDDVEADNFEKHSTNSVESEDDDCLPDSLHLYLDIEPTNDDNSTCTPANEGSDSVL